MNNHIFSHDSFARFISQYKLPFDGTFDETVVDYYLNKDLIVRSVMPTGSDERKTSLIGEYLWGYDFDGVSKTRNDDPAVFFEHTNTHPQLILRYKRKKYIRGLGDVLYFDAPMRVVAVQHLPETSFERLKEPVFSLFEYFKRKIGICGGPSSGKTSFARQLTTLLDNKLGCKVSHVTEYATTFLQKYGRKPTMIDQVFIYQSQLDRENSCNQSDVIVSDCPVFLAYLYARALCKMPDDQSVYVLGKLYKRTLSDVMGYSNFVYMKLLDYTENNIRCYGAEHAQKIDKLVKDFLDTHSIPYMECDYNVDVNTVCGSLFNIN